MRIRKYESHTKQLTTQEQAIAGTFASDTRGKCTIYDMTAKFWSSKCFTHCKTSLLIPASSTACLRIPWSVR